MNLGVSVLIPAHGDSPYLISALDSVLLQSFPSDWEIVLVVQNLNNNLFREIEKRYRNYPLNLIQDSESGIVSALNLGLEKCKYEIIARLDSDDLMLPNRIMKQLKVLSSGRYVAVGGQIELIDGDSKLIGLGRYPITSFVTKWALDFTCCLPHPGVTYLKGIVMQAGGYRKEFQLAEDYDLWLRMRSFGKIRNIRETVIQYRRHTAQSTSISALENFNLTAELISGVSFTSSNRARVSSKSMVNRERRWLVTMKLVDTLRGPNRNSYAKFIINIQLLFINPLYALKKVLFFFLIVTKIF